MANLIRTNTSSKPVVMWLLYHWRLRNNSLVLSEAKLTHSKRKSKRRNLRWRKNFSTENSVRYNQYKNKNIQLGKNETLIRGSNKTIIICMNSTESLKKITRKTAVLKSVTSKRSKMTVRSIRILLSIRWKMISQLLSKTKLLMVPFLTNFKE